MKSTHSIPLLLLLISAPAVGSETKDQARWRQPVSLVRPTGSPFIYVGNGRSGSVSLLDSTQRKVVAEFNVAKRIAKLARLNAVVTDRLLAIDDQASEVVLLGIGQRTVKRLAALAVAKAPRGMAVLNSGKSAVVSSTWARRLTFVDIVGQRLVVKGIVDLPFSPQELVLFSNDRYVLAADAFGGQLAVIGVRQKKLEAVMQLQGHKLRGLSASRDGRSIWVPQQLLFAKNYTSRDAVHWGGVMKNVVRRIPTRSLLKGMISRVAEAGQTTFLGYPDAAAGDPEGFLTTSKGRQVIALSGVDQVAVSEVGGTVIRIDVGHRPTSLLLDKAEQNVWVANTFDDTVSLVRLRNPRVVGKVSLGPARKLKLVEKGERLFFAANLSSDGWFSCHSCHVDGHTNHRLNDNFGDQTTGAPKRVLSLLGVGHTGPWAWNGKVNSLEKQIERSILATMQGPKPKRREVAAIAKYLNSLSNPPPVTVARSHRDKPTVERGKKLFGRLSCTNCHSRPNFTSAGRYDVGLTDQRGETEFNPPSLIGVGHRRNLFHDNRGRSLRDVFRRYRHGLKRKLKANEEDDLLAYLKSL